MPVTIPDEPVISVLPPLDGVLLSPALDEVGAVTVSVLVLGPSDGPVDGPPLLVLVPAYGEVAEEPVTTEDSDARPDDSDGTLDPDSPGFVAVETVAVEVIRDVSVRVVSVSLLVIVVSIVVVLNDSVSEISDDSVLGPVDEGEPPEDVGPVRVPVGSVNEPVLAVTTPEEVEASVLVPTEEPGVVSLSDPVLGADDDSGMLDGPSVGVLPSPDEGMVVTS